MASITGNGVAVEGVGPAESKCTDRRGTNGFYPERCHNAYTIGIGSVLGSDVVGLKSKLMYV